MDKQKVLVISNMYPTDKHKSFGIFVKNQVEALREEGFEVDVVSIDESSRGKLNVSKNIFWFLHAFFNDI